MRAPVEMGVPRATQNIVLALAYPKRARAQDVWQGLDPERVQQLRTLNLLVCRTYGKGLIQSLYGSCIIYIHSCAGRTARA